METLERLLKQPLKAISDNGFSLQVIEKINRYQTIRFRVLLSLYSILTLIFFSFLPVSQLAKNFINNLTLFCTAISHYLTPNYSEPTIKNISLSQLVQEPITLCTIMIITCLSLVFLMHNTE
jgi:hypothetical protein